MGTLVHGERRQRRRRHRLPRLGLRDLLAAGHGRLLAIAFVALCISAGSGVGWLVSSGPSGGTTTPTPENPAVAPPLGGATPTTPSAIVDPSASTTPTEPAPAAGAPDGDTPATRIRIDRLGIDLRIIEGDGVDAPIGKAAHFPGSAWPGGGSNVYLYAHAQEGMFLDLWDAKVGDEVVLRLADRSEVAYRVTEVLPKVAWNAVEYTQPTDREVLTLQTCTSYGATAPRFVVLAEPAW